MILQGLVDAIPKVFYLLTMSILSIIDFFQLLMRKLAGLDCYYVGEGENAVAQSGDIVYDFVTGIFTNSYPILSTVFWGLVILGFILLFLSTIIAIIRSEYTTEKADNGKGKIMFKAFKSVIFFAIVPIVSIMGIYLANLVLVAVDKATTPNGPEYGYLDTSKLEAVPVLSFSLGKPTETTSYVTYSLFGYRNQDNKKDGIPLPYGSTTTTFSGVIFKASAYNANRVRVTAGKEDAENFAVLLQTGQVTNFDKLFYEESGDTAKLANKIDIAFGDNVVFKKFEALDFSSKYANDHNNLMGDPWKNSEVDKKQVCADKFNVQLVWYYYDLWSFNFIIALGAGIICVTIFINIIFGLMRRIIEVVGLFLIAPPLIGLMPLDNEKAYGSWRGSFIKKVLMAYGAIGGMNIIFLLLPELQKIKFFNNFIIDGIVDTLIVLVALLAIKDFIGIVSSLAGGDDANKVGEGVGKDVGDLAGKALKIGASTAGLAAGVGKAAFTVGKKGFDAAKWASHAVRGNSVNKKASAANRDKYHDKDMALAREDAIKDYGKIEANRTDADLALQREYGMSQVRDWMLNDSQKYEEMLESQLAKDFDSKAAVKTSAEYRNLDSHFNTRQAGRNITNKDVAETQTKFGQRVAENRAYKENLNELKRRKRAGVGGVTRADIRLAKKQGWKDDFAFIGKQISDIGQPVASSGVNAVNELTSVFKSNSFYQGFMGKDNDTLADVAYRLAGTTKKAVDKNKAKAKEQKAQIDQLAAQQKMILEALRQLEEERNRRK